MSISAIAVGEAPLAAQPPGPGRKGRSNPAPANRRLVAKADAATQPEPR